MMNKTLRQIFSYILIIAGALLASFSVACILIPNDAIDYGTAGIAILLNKVFGWNLSICVFAILIPFIVAGAIFLGRSFFIKAVLGSIAYTVGLTLFEEIPFELNTEHFLAVAFGGAILGAGLALILRNGGCIDGSEIFANIAVKIISAKTGKNFGLTYILIIFNALLYITVFFVLDRNSAMLSLLVYVIATVIIDHFTNHFEAIKQVTIITKSPDLLVAQIKEELNKTCTIIQSKGAISGDNSTLICYINYFELQQMRSIVSRNKGTFSTVTNIDEILR